MIHANVRIEEPHITAAKLAGSEELVILLEQKAFDQVESKLIKDHRCAEGQLEASWVATNAQATAKYRKTWDRRMRRWRNASFSGLCAKPSGFKSEGTNLSRLREYNSSIPFM